MSGFFQLFLVWGVLLLFILILYLIDKVNGIYRGQMKQEEPLVFSDSMFGELQGKTLWDAMSGIPIPGVDPQVVAELKSHYESILRQNIEQVFMDGYRDGFYDKPGIPANNRNIGTQRGSVQSWLPLHHLASIYNAGVDFSNSQPGDILMIQQTLDQIASMLYARCGLTLTEPYSTILLIHPTGMGPKTSPVIAAPPAPVEVAKAVVETPPAVEAPPVLAPSVEPDVAHVEEFVAQSEVMDNVLEQALPEKSTVEAKPELV